MHMYKSIISCMLLCWCVYSSNVCPVFIYDFDFNLSCVSFLCHAGDLLIKNNLYHDNVLKLYEHNSDIHNIM